MALGPIEWMEIGFPGSKLSRSIVLPLKKLVDSGTIRIIDLVVLHKDSEGVVTAVELEGLEPDEAELFADLDGDVLGLLNDEDIAFAAEALAPGSGAAILVWEDLWISAFAQSVQEAGGRLVGHDRVPDEVARAALEAASV
ncbi:MAG TPA: DUF6325 family protein [Streptosporangiaceae bacterium]|nr:DUF6325 family protein [Streptosporangiaceae bacterium]